MAEHTDSELVRRISDRLAGDATSTQREEDRALGLAGVDASLAPLVTAWLDGAAPDDERLAAPSVEGYSVPSLVEGFSMTVPAAILTLDWLVRDPAAATAAIARGVDHVGQRLDVS